MISLQGLINVLEAAKRNGATVVKKIDVTEYWLYVHCDDVILNLPRDNNPTARPSLEKTTKEDLYYSVEGPVKP